MKKYIISLFIILGLFACSGSMGPPGSKGDPGAQGKQGESGIQGNPGIDGMNGEAGPMGNPGSMGEPGIGAAGASNNTVIEPSLFNVIISGQSNAVGQGIIPTTQPWIIDSGVIYDVNGTLTPFKPDPMGLHGIELSLGSDLDALGSNVIISKSAHNGAPCGFWVPKNNMPDWVNLVATLNFAKQYNGKYSFIWIQGETDASSALTTVDSYYSCVKSIFDGVKVILGNNVKFYILAMNIHWDVTANPGWKNVRQAEVNLSTEPNTTLVIADDITPGAGIHYISPQYLEIGHRFAKAELDNL